MLVPQGRTSQTPQGRIWAAKGRTKERAFEDSCQL